MGNADFMQTQIQEKLEKGFNCIKLKIGVDDAEHLNRAIANLERIQGIYEIKRVIH